MDEHWLQRAIELSKQCPKVTRSFAVGAVITSPRGEMVSAGFSLELGPGWHAEEAALEKARRDTLEVAGCTMYCSLEPCSTRQSRPKSCSTHIIEAGITRVVFALHEPPVFVTCEGTDILQRHGVEVVCLADYAPLVAEINRHVLHDTQQPPSRVDSDSRKR